MNTPTVGVERVKFGGLWRWRVICCPFCGKRRAHIHGANNLAGETRENTLGQRVAHCQKKPENAEYILRDAAQEK
jgi:hypothetical protein